MVTLFIFDDRFGGAEKGGRDVIYISSHQKRLNFPSVYPAFFFFFLSFLFFFFKESMLTSREKLVPQSQGQKKNGETDFPNLHSPQGPAGAEKAET